MFVDTAHKDTQTLIAALASTNKPSSKYVIRLLWCNQEAGDGSQEAQRRRRAPQTRRNWPQKCRQYSSSHLYHTAFFFRTTHMHHVSTSCCMMWPAVSVCPSICLALVYCINTAEPISKRSTLDDSLKLQFCHLKGLGEIPVVLLGYEKLTTFLPFWPIYRHI